MTKFSVIITAGGTSSRYGNKNKLLEIIKDKTVIEETIYKFTEFENINEIIITANQDIIQNISSMFSNNSKIIITKGGKTRQKSVFNGLQCVTNDYVLIHDGARPLITKDVIHNVMENVIKYNAVSVMTKTTDTIKEVDDNGRIIRTIDRQHLYNTQTPQAFKTELIKSAHIKLADKSYTDDASMLEELDIPVFIVNGNYTNIKITVRNDLDFAKIYI